MIGYPNILSVVDRLEEKMKKKGYFYLEYNIFHKDPNFQDNQFKPGDYVEYTFFKNINKIKWWEVAKL